MYGGSNTGKVGISNTHHFIICVQTSASNLDDSIVEKQSQRIKEQYAKDLVTRLWARHFKDNMELEVKIITKLETFLARKFGKKTIIEDEYAEVTFHTWRGNLYLTDIKLKGE